jgi:hypothetical protein
MPDLGLVTEPLFVPIRLHALTALVFGDFGFAAFFDGTHREKVRVGRFKDVLANTQPYSADIR